jgi:hypothetical protein
MIGRNPQTGEITRGARVGLWVLGLGLPIGAAALLEGCGFLDNGQKPTHWDPSYDPNKDPQANRTPSDKPTPLDSPSPSPSATDVAPFSSPSPTPNIRHDDDGRVKWPAYDKATTDAIAPGQRLALTTDSCGVPTGAVILQEHKNEPVGEHHYDIMVVTDGRQGAAKNDCDPDGTVPLYSQPTTQSTKRMDVPRGTAMLVDEYANTQVVCSSRLGNSSLWAMVEFTEGGSNYWVNFTNIGNPPQGNFDSYLGTPEVPQSQYNGLHGTTDKASCTQPASYDYGNSQVVLAGQYAPAELPLGRDPLDYATV